jgi:predicted nuclease of predicted toxin-antitoxin system
LKTAHEQDRIFVTRDRDYGNLVFVKGMNGGVLYLRMLPETRDSVHSKLKNVLQMYSESELKSAFVVIEANGHRFRRL